MPALWLDRLPLPNLPAYTAVSVILLLCSLYFTVVTQEQFERHTVSYVSYEEGLQQQCLVSRTHRGDVRNHKTFYKEYLLFLSMYPTQQTLYQTFMKHKLRSDFLYWPTSAFPSKFFNKDAGLAESSSLFFAPHVYYNSADVWEKNLSNPSISTTSLKLLAFMIHEPLCVWTLINMAYCLLVLLGKSIQQSMFGELRVSEQTQLKDKFWNFVFYKFIFVFGVINVQNMDEVVLWCSWFSALGFLHLLTQLCRDRFEYLSLSVSTPRRTHARLLCLLSVILGLSFLLLAICGYVGIVSSVNTFAFMAAECVLLLIRTVHIMIRYAIHLYDVSQTSQWERKGAFVYMTELIFEVTELVIDLLHHLHMLLWGNIFLSMASLIICMELRHIFYQIQLRLRRHSNYRRVVRYIRLECASASPADLASGGDQCAICWDQMEAARKLECSHCFHATCLRQWLEQDHSCPTCRRVLDLSGKADETAAPPEGGAQRRPQRRQRLRWQRQGGSRFVSFLPSFSVEVNHTQLPRASQHQDTVPASQLDAMARQIQQMFPHVSLAAIVEDLEHSGSLEATVDNILDGRVQDAPVPPMFTSDELAATAAPPGGDRWNHESRPLPTEGSTPDSEQAEEAQEETTDRCTGGDDTSPSDPREEELPVPSCGARFSKSPTERETLLRQRKEAMLQRARRRYLNSAAAQQHADTT